MSNDYNDWEKDRITEEKAIVAKYPFLQTRDFEGTPDMEAKFPLISLEIPNGWYKLFFQMCDDIKPLIEKTNLMDNFHFIQVKEKYNYLRCYNGGMSTPEIQQVIEKYEQMSPYICTNCGKPAVVKAHGYIASFCEDCWKAYFSNTKAEWVKFNDYFAVSSSTTHFKEERVSFKNEWERYINERPE